MGLGLGTELRFLRMVRIRPRFGLALVVFTHGYYEVINLEGGCKVVEKCAQSAFA